MICYNSKYSTIHLLEGMSLLYSEWTDYSGDLSEEEVKGEMGMIIEKVEEHHPKFIIADTKLFGYKMTAETQSWLLQNFIGSIIDLGVVRYAIVVPESVYPQFAETEEDSDEPLDEDFKVKYFPNKDQAMAWLIDEDFKIKN